MATESLSKAKSTPRSSTRNEAIVSNDVGRKFVMEQLNNMGLNYTQLGDQGYMVKEGSFEKRGS